MRTLIVAMVGLATIAGSNALSEDGELSAREAEKAVSVRQSLFSLIGWNIGGLGPIARGRAPYDADTVEESAERLAQLGAMIPDAFAADTSTSGIRSEARPVIWTEFDAFTEHATAMTAAAEDVRGLAAAGDEEAALAAIRHLASTCKSCHQSYRTD
ncbi:MAG: cytochrome c [Pseudomonadota bacterium]